MQRDKRGRFVKKALTGTNLTTPSFSLNDPLAEQKRLLDSHHMAFGGESKPFAPQKIKYRWENGKMVDMNGKELNMMDVYQNSHRYELEVPSFNTTLPGVTPLTTSLTGINNQVQGEVTQQTEVEDPSAGRNIFNDKEDKEVTVNPTQINKTKLADFLELTRAGIGASVNNKIAERALEAEKPFLQDVSESHRSVYGDYRSQIQGEKAAAQLRNMASKPLTSDGALQQQMMMEAQIKGQEYIDQGNAKDEAMIKQTREVAWQQEKENQQQRQAVAMQNKQAMLMSAKNKTQIENARDSANYSQVVAPLLGGIEQRFRTQGKEQEYYQYYYDDILTTSNVWNSYESMTELSDSQKALAKIYLSSGVDGLSTYVGEDETKKSDWIALKRIMENEIIRRKAAIKGAVINPQGIVATTANKYGLNWENPSLNFKAGGTIYKAKLTKRTKDNDRGAKSIESSRKIAARFLEKAIDSLYDYNNVELIAKPKKKRKYQAGGGLPFVGFTPVFATSEKGAPTPTKEETKKGTDLTTKDILELLKDIDGLPSDIDAIQASLANFVLADQMDPLGLDSSSSIASRYMSLIGRIKKAKANREWYDKAYDKLRNDGALNEYAVDSTGHFIGMDASGEFTRFTAKQVADGEVGNYQLLTNSNLLDIRARYPNAAFNSNLIMEASNGISMNQITEHISKIVQGLGSDKNQTQIFGDQSKEVLAGLRQLQQAAQQVGQDLSISDLYEASVFTESQAKQAELALNYIYQTMPTNMKALLFAKAGSQEGALNLINNLVTSKLSSTTKLEFSPKNKKGSTSSGKTGNVTIDGLDLSPAQMLQQGFGERETIIIQDATSTGLRVDAITMPITTGDNKPMGSGTLEDIATSQYGGLLNFTNASMGGKIIPFEGRRNIAVDGSKIYSMYLPIDQDEFIKGNIVPDIDLIDKVNTINKQIKDQQITDPSTINKMYVEAGLPVYLNDDGTVVPTFYRRFGVVNGTALDNAFGKDFVASRYLKQVDDEDLINGAITIMNHGRSKEDRVEYDAKNFFNFGGLLGDYDTVYQGTIFIPMSNDVFLGIAGSGKTINSTEANDLEAKQQQHERVSATYNNPGQLR